jgi:hypothetical protein
MRAHAGSPALLGGLAVEFPKSQRYAASKGWGRSTGARSLVSAHSMASTLDETEIDGLMLGVER